MHGKLHPRFAVLLIAGLMALATVGSASEITGKVVLSGRSAADVVLSVEGVQVESAPDATVYVVDHHNLNFTPHVLVIRAGSTVRFENSDGMPCHIYSISPAGLFALRRQDGKPMAIKFDRPGIIVVRCAQHGRIYAYIIVKENPYFALTDRKGHYKISKLPPGRYAVQGWYEGTVIATKTVEVGAGKLPLDFKADRPEPQVEKQPADLSSMTAISDFPNSSPNDSLTSWRKEQ